MSIEFDGYVGYIGQEVFADLGEIDGRWSFEEFFTDFVRTKSLVASIFQRWRLRIVGQEASDRTIVNHRRRCNDKPSPSIRPTSSCHRSHGPFVADQRCGLRAAFDFEGG